MMSCRLPPPILSMALLLWFCILIMKNIHTAEAASSSTHIVYMDKSTMPLVFSTHTHWHSSILRSLNAANPAAGHFLVYSHDQAVQGFSAVLSPQQLKRLREVPEFPSAYLDRSTQLHTTHTTKFVGLSHDTGLWPASDCGQDVVVGVVDTGLWPENPSFLDTGMTPILSRWKGKCEIRENSNSSLCNRKLIGARCFISGLRAENDHDDAMGSEESPRDTCGHETRASSIIAGNHVHGVSYFGCAPGNARGVAPKARLVMYKVANTKGMASDVIAATDQAIDDGVDVLSLSLRLDTERLCEDPIVVASFAAIEKGFEIA